MKDEASKSDRLRKVVVSLIRAHYETGEDDFLRVAMEVAGYFDEIGEYQLATYVRVLAGKDNNVFVPM